MTASTDAIARADVHIRCCCDSIALRLRRPLSLAALAATSTTRRRRLSDLMPLAAVRAFLRSQPPSHRALPCRDYLLINNILCLRLLE